MNNYVDIHADDFAYSVNVSKEIIQLLKEKRLDSFSFMANLADIEKCEEMFFDSIPSMNSLPNISVHLNLVEGKSLSGTYKPESWEKLFLRSFMPGRKKLKESLKKEIKEQIDRTERFYKKCAEKAAESGVAVSQKGLRIDSHVHTHPIPVVWEALMEVIEENNYEIEFVRNPKEPLIPFIQCRNLWGSYSPINIIKNLILNLLSGKIDSYSDKKELPKMYMWGLITSGHMDIRRIRMIYPHMIRYCEKKGRNLEILFHPGLALESEYSSEKNRSYFVDFNSSENRMVENKCVKEFER